MSLRELLTGSGGPAILRGRRRSRRRRDARDAVAAVGADPRAASRRVPRRPHRLLARDRRRVLRDERRGVRPVGLGELPVDRPGGLLLRSLARSRGEEGVGSDTCANAAWYPGYPMLTRAGTAVGLGWEHTAVFLSQLAFLGLLVLVWARFLDARPTQRNLTLLVLAGFFPGGVYYLAAFPISLLVLLLLVLIMLFEQRRWLLGALVGLVASAVYPISLVLGPAAALWAFLAMGHDPPVRRIGRAGIVGGLIVTGNLAVFAVHEMVLGRWDASIEQQRWFGATVNNPIRHLGSIVLSRESFVQIHGVEIGAVLAIQTTLVLIMVAVSIAVVVRGPRTVDDIGLAILIFAMWLLPLVNVVETGLYRREAALLPLVLLLRRAPLTLVGAAAGASIVVWIQLAERFHDFSLI
ncbi:MAG: hypothetical protein U5R31_09820 [Acidimicrobiia bacterium]|nr:hypothetical protein [Acidimicrobiia bacterium]